MRLRPFPRLRRGAALFFIGPFAVRALGLLNTRLQRKKKKEMENLLAVLAIPEPFIISQISTIRVTTKWALARQTCPASGWSRPKEYNMF